MGIFEYLQRFRVFERRYLPLLRTLEDFDMVQAIGLYQERGIPLTIKQLFTLDIGSVATLQRRLSRLKRLGVVVHTRSDLDKRNFDLALSPRTTRLFEKYAKLRVVGLVTGDLDMASE